MDYEALAKKYGGITTPANPNGADYSSLAQRYGGTAIPTNTINIPEQSNHGFIHNLLEAPITEAARPIQLAQTLIHGVKQASDVGLQETNAQSEHDLIDQLKAARDSGQDTKPYIDALRAKMNEFDTQIKPALEKDANFQPFHGGLVAAAPTELSYKALAPDIGRAIQTIGLGLGPVTGGAAIGLGQGIENRETPGQIALDTGLGVVGGKLLGAVAPKIAGAGVKVLDTVLPNVVKEGAATLATKAAPLFNKAAQFAENTKILPDSASSLVNNAANKTEKLFSGGASKLKSVITDQYKKPLTEDIINKAKESVAKKYEQALPLTPTEKAHEKMLLDKTGDNVYTTLVKHGISLGAEDAPVQIQQVKDLFHNTLEHARKNESAYFNINEMANNINKHINENVSSEVSRQTAKNKITNELQALIKNNPDSFIKGANGELRANSDMTERLRRTGNSWTNFDVTDPEKIGKSTGYALGNAVRDQVEKEGTFPSYRDANREYSKIIHAEKVINNMSAKGKKFRIPGGLSGSVARKVLSGALGFHMGGLPGAVLSELGSEMGAKIMANPELKTYFERKILERAYGGNHTPEVVANLAKEVSNHVAERENRILLGAGPIITPQPVIPTEEMKIFRAAKNQTSINPKTGKFQKTYNSSADYKNPVLFTKNK